MAFLFIEYEIESRLFLIVTLKIFGMKVYKLDVTLKPSSKRWLLRPFIPGNPQQVEHILLRILSSDRKKTDSLSQRVVHRYKNFQNNVESIFMKHYDNVKDKIASNMQLDENTKMIIGAYFSQFYALESTALCNPSIVLHPTLASNSERLNFVLSLRAVGEGHVSSVVFREGYIDRDFKITIHPPSLFIMEPQKNMMRVYDKEVFLMNLAESGAINEISQTILQRLPGEFTFGELDELLYLKNMKISNYEPIVIQETLNTIRNLALSNYDTYFEESQNMSERVIFPMSPSQTNGIEDARFIRFENEDGTYRYIATLTAYNGRNIVPELLETQDFLHFKVSTLSGSSAKNKGMAMFPKKINGKYMMLGRFDNESIYIMESENCYSWNNAYPLAKPTYSWEFIQIGNCSSPIELEEGWLVITHGVGAVRRYCLGALLLEKKNPRKVMGRLKKPLLEPLGDEAFGYVPNVLYTCGAIVFNRELILPYAVSDSKTKFARISVDEILNEMDTV